MEVFVKDNYEEICESAALLVAQTLQLKQQPVLGLATGSTPMGVYRELIRMHREEGLDFSHAITFNLDEYVGLDATDPHSYRHFMDVNFFQHVNVRRENTHVPAGVGDDLEACCRRYEQQIRDAGGIDLQLLGIGSDGHIAFNEPGSPLDSRTRIERLAPRTIQDNARFFDRIEDVPTHAITIGVGTILEARKIVLLVNGAGKAEALARSIEQPVSSECPASALQLHRDTTVLVDREAAGLLSPSTSRTSTV